VPLIEVTHGDGLGGSSVNYGFPAHSDEEYLSTVIPLMKQAKVSALLLPGIGTVDHLKMAHELGVSTIRVATHCTEADVSAAHHRRTQAGHGHRGLSDDGAYEQRRRSGQAGQADGRLWRQLRLCDRLGRLLLPDEVKERIAAVRAALKPETELGFHGHHNLAMGVANSIAAVEAGANRIDAAAAGLGAGAGNTPMEVLVAVCERMGIETGVDVWKIQDVAEDLVVPLMDFPIRVDRDALTLGYAGVYGSFLLFAKRAEKKYGIPARDLLVELGRRGMVGGQEDMIEDTALTMARARARSQLKRRPAQCIGGQAWHSFSKDTTWHRFGRAPGDLRTAGARYPKITDEHPTWTGTMPTPFRPPSWRASWRAARAWWASRPG
jgi:4-hydroxy-2-oxovalerate/4-hydroxy-2-oxohexanoate aldolase